MRVRIANLTDQRDLEIVRALRDGNPAYVRLKQTMQALFQGKRCVVIGSAPVIEEVDRRDGDINICVNGSFHNAERLGVVDADAHFLVNYIFTQGNRAARTVYKMLQGRHFETCVVYSGTLSFAASVAGLREAGATYGSIHDISTHERAALTGDVCGIELGVGKLEDRVSNGVTTAICALWAGAREVHLAGFSLAGGHSYTKFKSRRYHTRPDATFFALCKERRLPLTSASPELRERFGIPARI